MNATKIQGPSKSGRKTEIIKDASLYAGSTYAATFIDILNGIVTRNLIAPASMGIWSFLQVLLGYSKYATLGTGPALVREIPFRRGKGEHDKAERIKNNVFSWSLFTSSLLGIGIITYAVLMRNSLSKEMMWGLVTIAIVTVLQRGYNIYVVLLRAYKSFRLASLSNILSSLATLLLTLTVVWKFRFYGLLMASVTGYLVTLIVIHKNSNLHFRMEFDKEIFRDLSFLGLSLVAVQVCMTLLRSIDELVIAKCVNFEALGYYSVAVMFQTYLTILPNVVDMVLNPHLFEKAGQYENLTQLKKNVLEPVLAMACIMPCCILLSWVLVPSVVGVLMPKYELGIASARILLFSSFFIGTARPLTAYLIILKKHLVLIPILLIASAFSAVLNWYLVNVLHRGIETVALVSVLAYGLFFLLSLAFCSLSLITPKDLPAVGVKVMGPLLYVAGLTQLLVFLFPHPKAFSFSWMLELGLSVVFCLPLMFLLEKETGIVFRAKDILWERFKPKEIEEL